jgi:hypothetical protein
MASKEELIAKYKEEKSRLGRVEQALVIQKERVSNLAKTIFEAHGKGPHDLGDGREGGYLIVCRGGSNYYFSPVTKKGAKEGAEASV